MKIILIAALDKGRVIGSEGSIPWNIQEDLNYFKEKTTNKAIIMGRKTFESIGRPLPNRLNIVMTRSKEKVDGVITAPNKEIAIEKARDFSSEIFVIGGEYIYKEFLEMASEMLLTEIDLDTDGDTYFPRWEESEWLEVSRESKIDDSQKINYEFVKYKRRN
tara:strand:- start:264 stop:749 length:486 start_codon:yes stop_codon:yes gene_type:complete